ncbi:MAG: hypothetical protein KGL43_22900 [Burkholderiales bacterium]|nr:hypothetical protein [Burkholderiales bacterium]MDE2396088.1 hypothetical protein [Burkholderiales bacterium]MDE2456447.1 hypothetical protein [Burkholderiales bacterium]
MQADSRTPALARTLQSLAELAALLERLERQPSSASADQYRSLALQISALLESAEPGPQLDALLGAAPATATIYENLQYRHAGLCRSPLEQALNTEQIAVAAIGRARRAG